VVNSAITNVDVVSIASDERYAFVNYLKVMNGTIIQTQTIEVKKQLDESDDEILTLAMLEFRTKFNSTSKEIIVPFEPSLEDESLKFTVPKLGEKKKLLELSQKNVLFFKKEKLNQYEKLNPDLRTDRILTTMQKDLRLTQLPKHIECFDNSNFQGKYPVSAIVVFKDAKPSKKDYRHFNVKTVEGPNDFATMEEAVFRRYRRMLDENQTLPQLIIIDGGKGQLSSAVKSLKLLGIENKVTVIGIAKRLEELFYPGDSYPLYLDKKSETLKIIQQLRDEAHRHLHAIVRGVVGKQHLEELQRQQLVRHALVHEVGDKPRCGHQLCLVAGGVGAPEPDHETDQEEPADVRDLGVDDRRDRREHVGEGRAGRLRPEQRAAEQAAPADEVLGEELGKDVADVGGGGLVHVAGDAAPQRVPGLALVGWAGLVAGRVVGRRCCPRWRDVHAPARCCRPRTRHCDRLWRKQILRAALATQ
jgi:hypothetical protein